MITLVLIQQKNSQHYRNRNVARASKETAKDPRMARAFVARAVLMPTAQKVHYFLYTRLCRSGQRSGRTAASLFRQK